MHGRVDTSSAASYPAAHASIHPDTTVGTVRLTVSDLARARDFYERAIGLRAVDAADGSLGLGVPGTSPLLELHGDPSAPPLARRATGLFHFAILVPSRRDLAHALARLSDASWPLDGASDHLVSEALYLSDPDGNGIEIYRDRPRAEWTRSNGQLEMATLPLDLRGVVRELAGGEAIPAEVPPGTRMGHVHLQVSDLDSSEAFYNGVLGFDVIVRGYPGALFVSAGGYHHHLGLNTWNSAGAGPPAPGSIGLRSYDVVLPDEREFERVIERVQGAGVALESAGEAGAVVADPSGNRLLLRAAR